MFDNLKPTAVGTMSFAARRTTRQLTKSAQIIWATGAVTSLIYAIYASVTHSGLAGYAMKLEMDLFGGASDTTTLLLTCAALAVGFFLLMWVAERLVPSWVWIERDLSKSSQSDLIDRLNRPLVRISWRVVLVVTGLPIMVCAVIAGVSYYSDRQDRRAKIYHIDLASAVAGLPRGTRLVEVTGVLARSYAVMYKKTEDQTVTHELFAPLTVQGWTPRDPVRYVLHHEEREAYDGQVNWPESFLRRGATQISGKIGKGLPAYVESSFRSKGLKLDRTYSVIDWKDLRYLQRSSYPDGVFVPLCAGGLLSVLLFPILAMLRSMVARMAQARK